MFISNMLQKKLHLKACFMFLILAAFCPLICRELHNLNWVSD